MKDNSIAYVMASIVGIAFAAVCVGVWVGLVAKVAKWVVSL